MPPAAAAGAAGTASGSMLLCLLLSGRVPVKDGEQGGGRERWEREAMEAAETWWGEAAAAGAAVRFLWREVISKWPVLDLAFGVKYLVNRRGNLPLASVYTGRSVQLKGHGVMAELIHMSKLMKFCMFFSKKSYRVCLKSAGYSQEDVLFRVAKAGILKPAFIILCDKSSNSFLLVIRGMHSMRDVLTATNGAIVPFQHSFSSNDGVDKSVRGYAHCGMVAAARWIAKCATPYLLEGFNKHPDYTIKIVGNSLGGGTAALLTYILREHEEFSSSTCVSFAPAACVTWEIAESGKDFITTIINGSDQVPSCSITSINHLRSEVSSSSWLSDLWLQIRHSRLFHVVDCFIPPLEDNPESQSSAILQEDVGPCLHSVPTKTRVAMKCTKVVEENAPDTCTVCRKDTFSLVVQRYDTGTLVDRLDLGCSSGSSEKQREEPIHTYRVTAVSTMDKKSEGELQFKLVKELHGKVETDQHCPLAAEETRKEEDGALQRGALETPPLSPDASHMPKFYPPGKIMHMIAAPASDSSLRENSTANQYIGIYSTPRDLYSKIQLSKRMIKDHYMTVYKKAIELLIDRLQKDENGCTGTVL